MRSCFLRAFAACTLFSFLSNASYAADEPALTLESVLRQALSVSPEIREAKLEVKAREGVLDQATSWPNPTIELRGDQKLGLEDGTGGAELTQFAIRQPIPLARLPAQRTKAQAQLDQAREHLRYVQLQREVETARAAHELQLGQARLALAAERESFVVGLESGTEQRKDRIVRYLTPLERSRLAILREEAAQDAASAEGTYSEALAAMRALLVVAPDAQVKVVELSPVTPPKTLIELLDRLDQHPALLASDRDIDAAHADIDVARARRFADPVLGAFRERDYLGGQKRDYSGITLAVEIPLWNRSAGEVTRAKAGADQAEERRAALRRELESQVRQQHMHLNHLIEQSGNYRTRLVAPARKGLELARRGFLSGEQSVLMLIDAYDSYFDAQVRYQELLEEAWQEAAELRLSAGTALLPETAR